jgi:DNA-binding transcriptional LysR family regulator
MELLQLRYFFDSARTENFAKTAEKYMVPPSSVSASIKRLETELGCQLFDRCSNRIFLNENGRTLQRSLGMMFDELDRTVSELSLAESEKPEIKMLAKSLREVMTNALIEYRELHPNQRFLTVFDFDEDYEEYDLIVDERNESYVGYEKMELCTMRIRLCAAPDSPLCGRPLTLRQLRNQNFVTMGKQSNAHRLLVKACKNVGFVPNIVMEINDTKCYGKCIHTGMGIGLSREPAETKPSESAKNFLLVSDFEELQTYYIYYKKTGSNSNLQNFVDYLRKRDFWRSGV